MLLLLLPDTLTDSTTFRRKEKPQKHKVSEAL